MNKVYVLMRPYQRRGFPAVFVPFGVVGDERVAQERTATGDKYYAAFEGEEGRWIEKVVQEREVA